MNVQAIPVKMVGVVLMGSTGTTVHVHQVIQVSVHFYLSVEWHISMHYYDNRYEPE